ncbi:MAG: UDP-glucose 4-epimerase GalE [Gammaproteobacteria bacterium]|nr:UDP-glucose 4-epimerase GalE [Gammaproteobacteria bacterium]MBU1645240.1 UDP-glucose 4-epimerase GalE [Gammaproteobacteria bacterium]MBU1971577.1 UDP-glucose 4-epimerase GalE [Gammaproteobacteria bacterium]
MKILVTGGAGYIGSHTVVELLAAGHHVTVLDNLCNSKASVIDRIETIAGKRPVFVQADVRNRAALTQILPGTDAVIHFAGLKAVGESVAQPLRYYDNNVGGSVVLLDAMAETRVKTIVFSSSATVYAASEPPPWAESVPLGPINPYGRSKLMVEDMLRDLNVADPGWRIGLLRYFNPVGAHASGLIGEDPNGIPSNLLPYVAQVAVGKLARLQVFGGDYPTPDGTGVRDYIHVVDLALGHLAALDYLRQQPGPLTVNLGTGRGYSVLEVVRAFERASGQHVPFDIVDRRSGDAPSYYADVAMAQEAIGWRAERDINAMCADAWRWQSANPAGYPDK